MTDWRSHNHIGEAQVQVVNLLLPGLIPETSHNVCCLKQEGHIGQERGELPLLVTWLLNPKQPAKGHAQGGFLKCGSSLNHEIDSPRDLVTFPPPVFTWRGERLHSEEDVQSLLWRWYR